ncbi:MAG: HD-GYP domain-containing protein, partial [Clostridia bacterium]|nr:HD-GYP domain-containing protein [Clostridia bacterium]
DDGVLYIAGSTGVCKVNIEEPFEDVNELKVAVPYVEADGNDIYPDASGVFTIPSETQKLTVPSFVFNYSLNNPQVSYQLEGFERSSTTVVRSDMVPVDYTNLRGGTYHYVMQLKDNMGRGNKIVTVTINKEKAFYEQTWFYIVCTVLIGFILEESVRLYVRKKTRAMEKKHRETMTLVKEITEAFAKVIDMKDQYTNGHSSRVAQFTRLLSEELGYDEETVEKYYQIALLHDIGKVGIPQEVLNKPGRLTDEEFQTIKSHTVKGYETLKNISIMPELAIGAQAHHERPDGKGYPNHLKGDEIPRVAQIIAVADCFDAMYSNRPYRNRMNFEKVVSIIKEVSGTQLTPDVVDAFPRLVDRGYFRAEDDLGGGTTETVDNIKS